MAFAKLILACFLLSGVAVAAPGLAQSRTEILQLGARLNALEKQLGQHNNKYLSAIERIRVLETDLVTYQQRLTETAAAAKKREAEMAAILRSHALSLVEDEVVPTEAYQKLVQQNRERAQAAAREAETLTGIVDQFQQRLAELKRDEEELLAVSQELELKKRQLTEVYLAKLEQKQKLESREQKQKITTQISAIRKAQLTGADIAPAQKFRAPIANWTEVLPSDKGVTFKLGQQQPIAAPRAGRIAYNGDLATYGKVLMIDHGDDIRTVMLGRFSSTLAKNTEVRLGDVLGHTEQDSDSLYFEVRKKNVAQKTIHWMEPAAIGKI